MLKLSATTGTSQPWLAGQAAHLESSGTLETIFTNLGPLDLTDSTVGMAHMLPHGQLTSSRERGFIVKMHHLQRMGWDRSGEKKPKLQRESTGCLVACPQALLAHVACTI